MNYPLETIIAANQTSRSSGCVGRYAIVPKYIAKTSGLFEKILDFGAGKQAVHAAELKGRGFNVVAHDFGANFNLLIHDNKALMRGYNTVYLSNVINTLNNSSSLRKTLNEAWNAVCSGGRLVFNYPTSPRKLSVSTQVMFDLIKATLAQAPARVGGTKQAPIWEIKK